MKTVITLSVIMLNAIMLNVVECRGAFRLTPVSFRAPRGGPNVTKLFPSVIYEFS